MKTSFLYYSKFYFVSAVLILVSQLAFAQTRDQSVQSDTSPKNNIRVLNEIIFHLQKKAYTLFDLRQFESAKADVLEDLTDGQSRLIKKLNAYETLLLYVICQKEAEALDLNLEPKTIAKLVHEKKDWKIGYLRGSLYLQTKENLFSDPDRFNSWFQMLKNKYDFFKKTSSVTQ